MCVGVYCLLDGTTPRVLATPLLVTGCIVGGVGISLSGRGVSRTAYRPDSWRLAEVTVVASGLVAGTLVWLTSRVDPADLNPSLSPLAWPQVSLLPILGIMVGLAPALLAPLPADARAPVAA
jgi:energy-coupling factor transport system permease protein